MFGYFAGICVLLLEFWVLIDLGAYWWGWFGTLRFAGYVVALVLGCCFKLA